MIVPTLMVSWVLEVIVPKDTKVLTNTVKHSILSKVIKTNKELQR